MPEIRITDDLTLPNGSYVIKVHGVTVASDVVRPDKFADPAPRRPLICLFAAWGRGRGAGLRGARAVDRNGITRNCGGRWAASHHTDCIGEVLATHLMETVQTNLDRLFTRRALKILLDAFVSPSDPDRAKANQQLLDDFVPDKVPMDLLQTVLRLLLAERVPVRNLQLILEAISEARSSSSSPEQVTDYVRRRIGYIVTSSLLDETGALPLIQLDASWETLFAKHQQEMPDGSIDVAIPPNEFNRPGKVNSGQAGRSLGFRALCRDCDIRTSPTIHS